MEKVILKLPENSWHGHATETVWAEKVGENRYRLRNVPFFAKGVSVEDVVTTYLEQGRPMVEGVSLRGGHSTYRLFLSEADGFRSKEFEELWSRLEALGCTYERATERLLAVDVPHSSQLAKAYAVLQDGEAAGIWNFEEGHAATA